MASLALPVEGANAGELSRVLAAPLVVLPAGGALAVAAVA
jgi:hypothetical protein